MEERLYNALKIMCEALNLIRRNETIKGMKKNGGNCGIARAAGAQFSDLTVAKLEEYSEIWDNL